MANKYISLVSGIKTMIEALVTSAGAGDAGKIPALDAGGRLDISLMPNGIGADTVVRPASENLSAGNLVNIWNDGGTMKVRKADAANGYAVHGFVSSGVTSPADATVYLEGTITGLTSLSLGARYYLSATAGLATATPVSTAGYFSQYIGVAVSATEIAFEADDYIVVA